MAAGATRRTLTGSDRFCQKAFEAGARDKRKKFRRNSKSYRIGCMESAMRGVIHCFFCSKLYEKFE